MLEKHVSEYFLSVVSHLLFLPLDFHLQSVRGTVDICTDTKADRQGKWTDRQKAKKEKEKCNKKRSGARRERKSRTRKRKRGGAGGKG